MKWGVAPSFAGYPRADLPRDAVAGLTVWAVLVPKSLAYATIAGVPPVVGLYAAVPALALYALLGTSRQLVVSPMSATAALSIGVAATVSSNPHDVVGLTTALALATGLVAIVAGLLRLGFLASFISEPVLKGFIIGLALTILIGQVPDLLGISKSSGNFVEKTWHIVTHLNQLDGLTTAAGLLSLGALVVLRRFLPLLPGSLIAALGGDPHHPGVLAAGPGARDRGAHRSGTSVRTRVRELAAEAADGPDGLKLVVLDGSSSPSIDVTAAGMLTQLREDVRRLGGELVLSDNIGQVRDVLATAEESGEPPMFATLDEALASISRGGTSDPGLSPGTGDPPTARPAAT